SRQLAAEDPLPRSAEATDDAAEERSGQAATSVGFTNRAVRPGDRRGVDLDAYFVLLGDGQLDFCESLNVRRPIPVVDNCFHETPFLLSFGCKRPPKRKEQIAPSSAQSISSLTALSKFR